MKTNRNWAILQVLFVLSLLVSWAWLSTYSYLIGVTNIKGLGDSLFEVIIYWMGFIVIVILYLVVVCFALVQRRGRLITILLLGVLILGILSIEYFLPHGYERGFSQWVQKSIKEQQIVAWMHTLPSTTVPVQVSQTNWPPVINALTPNSVEQHPTGIVLQWGIVAAWGTSRKVFIANPNVTVTPVDIHHYWIPVRPGLWCGIQVGG